VRMVFAAPLESDGTGQGSARYDAIGMSLAGRILDAGGVHSFSPILSMIEAIRYSGQVRQSLSA